MLRMRPLIVVEWRAPRASLPCLETRESVQLCSDAERMQWQLPAAARLRPPRKHGHMLVSTPHHCRHHRGKKWSSATHRTTLIGAQLQPACRCWLGGRLCSQGLKPSSAKLASSPAACERGSSPSRQRAHERPCYTHACRRQILLRETRAARPRVRPRAQAAEARLLKQERRSVVASSSRPPPARPSKRRSERCGRRSPPHTHRWLAEMSGVAEKLTCAYRSREQSDTVF